MFDHEIPEQLLEALAEWCPDPVEQETFNSYWKMRAETPSDLFEDDDLDSWPRHLPHEEFPMFLAEVRRQVPAEHAEIVEQEFRSTVAAAQEMIAGLKEVSEEALASVLRGQLKAARRPTQALTRVRAFQVAAFHHGFLLKVDQAALLASDLAEFNQAVSDPEAWRLLRSYRQPFRGAANACLAAGVEIEDAPTIKVGEVSDDGGTITTAGNQIDVPPEAAVFLRALAFRDLLTEPGPTSRCSTTTRRGRRKRSYWYERSTLLPANSEWGW